MKLSDEKGTLPGRKQVYRVRGDGGAALRDVVTLRGEDIAGEPLLEHVMADGRRLPAGQKPLEQARALAREESRRLPARLRSLEPAVPAYPVEISPLLRSEAARLRATLEDFPAAETRTR